MGVAVVLTPRGRGGGSPCPPHVGGSAGPAHGLRSRPVAGQEAAFCIAPSGPTHRPRGQPSGPDGGSHLAPGRPHWHASALALPSLGEPHAPLLGGEGSPEALPVCFPERVTPVTLGPGPKTNPLSRSWTWLPVSSPGRASPILHPPRLALSGSRAALTAFFHASPVCRHCRKCPSLSSRTFHAPGYSRTPRRTRVSPPGPGSIHPRPPPSTRHLDAHTEPSTPSASIVR